MSDFNDLLKIFALVPAVKDTSIPRPNLKIPVRAIGLVRQQILVPPIDFGTIYVPQAASIWYQYNYTAATQFRITNIGELRANVVDSIIKAVVCIRYRIGTTVYRYLLTGSTLDTAKVPSLLYSGQIIKPNFVIEVWRLNGGSPTGIFNALTLTTSIVRSPLSQDDYLPDQVVSAQNVTHDMLTAPLNPETLPTTYDAAGSWLTN